MRVIFFDIDGTLINTNGAGGSALREAFRETFDISELGKVEFSGRTDRGIIKNLLNLHGIEWTAEGWEQVCERYLLALPQYLHRKQGHVLGGVEPLLDALRPSGAQVGLLTGNLRQGAQLKLAHFGLDHFFAFGGFGDHHEDRDDVARAAVQEAVEFHQRERFDEVWVVGDTPLDVRCARAIGARVIAVATGVHARDELAALAPDVLVEDLSDQSAILGSLLG